MIFSKQIEILIGKAVDSYIHGITGNRDEFTTPNRIPTPGDISSYIRELLNNNIIGRPFFKAVKQGDVTSASKFNDNVRSLIDDFTVLNEEMLSQIYAVSRHMQLSEMEYKKLYGDLKVLYNEINSLILVSNNSKGYLYEITDSFNNADMIDTSRSTCIVDTTGGLIQSSESTVEKYRMDHYKEATSPDEMSVSKDYVLIDYVGTKFKDCMLDSENRNFMVKIDTKHKDGIGIDIVFTVSKDGNNPGDVPVSEVVVYTVPGLLAGLSFINSTSYGWVDLYSGIETGMKTKFPITADVASNSVQKFKLTLFKNEPDSFVNGVYSYAFLIKNVSVYNNTMARSSTMITKSLSVPGITYSPYTINQVSLVAEEEVPDGCSVEYYVAVDPYIAGKLVDGSNNPVTSESTNIESFDLDGNYSGASGTLTSVLREVSIDGYEDWEPVWIPISPSNRKLGTVNSTVNSYGQSLPKIVNLGNVTVNDNEVTGWDNTVYSSVNGITVYSICTFDSKPYNLKLYQGKGCWVRRNDNYSAEVDVESIGRFILNEDDDNYYLYIGTGYGNTDGYILSRGSVVPGSISSITWFVADSATEGTSMILKDQYPEFIADVYIKYDNGRATIQKNPTATWSYPEYTVRVRYRIKDPTSTKYVYETTYYVEEGTVDNNASIVITDTNNVDMVTSSNPELNYKYSARDTIGNETITVPLIPGYNTVKIYASNDFSPSGIVESSTTEHYAFPQQLTQTGSLELINRTHRDDHSKCSVVLDNGQYSLLVNNPVTPDSVLYYHDTDGVLASGDIFDTTGHVDSFYDLEYSVVDDEVTNLFLRIDINGSETQSPVIRSYSIRCGDNIVL